MIPWAWQQAATDAFDQLGGVWVAAPVGAGKSFVGRQCAQRAKRPLAVAPASLLKQTKRNVCENAVSYNKLSRQDDYLERERPDVLILDEAHRVKNVSTAQWSKQIARYLAAHPEVRVVVLTGSVMHKSVVDYGHLLVWALRRGAPCPGTMQGIQAAAKLAAENPAWWLERLRSAPGVFLVGDQQSAWQGRLIIREHVLPPLAPDAFDAAQTTWTAPDGWECEDQLSAAELCRQLAWGFYLRREPRPSPELVAARRDWSATVRYALTYGLAGSEPACRTRYPERYAKYAAAEAAEPSVQVPEWLAEPALPFAPEPGTIVWVHHRALGRRLSELHGWPYHGEGTLDAHGVPLSGATASVVLASTAACKEGVDGAQHRYHRNIVLEPDADPRVWEQRFGRLCRYGQPLTEVYADILLRGPHARAALEAARKAAHKIESETGQIQWLTRGVPV